MNRARLEFDPIERARLNWQGRGWHEAAGGMAMVTSVIRAQQILLARVHKSLAPFGLTFPQYETLMLLHFSRVGQLPLGKIGERLQVHPASVTNVVDRLESKGLVVRAPHSSDRRATLAVLTDAGRSLAEVATLRLNEEVFGAVGVANQKVESLVELITELRFLAGDFSAAPTTGSPAGPTRESRDTPPDNRENVH